MRKDPESSNFNPHAARCAARSKRTGRRCRNPAVHGKRVCRLHGGLSLSGEARTAKQKANRPPAAGKPNRGCFSKGNQAARKHGAYTAHLLPEEREEYDRLIEKFSASLARDEPVTAADELLLHLLALAIIKSEAAAVSDASVRVGAKWLRLELRLMRELRMTRASRGRQANMNATKEQVLARLLERIRERWPDGVPPRGSAENSSTRPTEGQKEAVEEPGPETP